jgi:hypothetical protein
MCSGLYSTDLNPWHIPAAASKALADVGQGQRKGKGETWQWHQGGSMAGGRRSEGRVGQSSASGHMHWLCCIPKCGASCPSD